MSCEMFSIGRTVLCDLCNEDYTDKLDTGGCLVDSYACCPECTKKMQTDANAEDPFMLNDVCPNGVPFAIWVRQDLRKGNPGCMFLLSGIDAINALRSK